jgi:hypothetical protein
MDFTVGHQGATKAFRCAFDSKPPWVPDVDKWIAAITRFAEESPLASSDAAAYAVWRNLPQQRKSVIDSAAATVADPWDLMLVSKWSDGRWPEGPSPFEMVAEAIASTDLCNTHAKARKNGQLYAIVEGTSLYASTAPDVEGFGQIG